MGTTYELINLVPYTEYTIWIQAVNENGPGASSNEIVIRTYSSQPTKPPHNVTLEAANSTVLYFFFPLLYNFPFFIIEKLFNLNTYLT